MVKEENTERYPLALVCFESNLVNVPPNSWWLDTGASIHITHSLQGFKRSRKPSDAELSLTVGDGNKVEVKDIGVVSL